MNKKTITMFSVLMVVVFGAIVFVYPMMFNPDGKKSGVPAGEPMPPITAPAAQPSH